MSLEPSGSVIKNPPAMQEMQETLVQSLGGEDPLEEEMATHSSILAWKFPWQRKLVGYSPWGRQEVDTTEHSVVLRLKSDNGKNVLDSLLNK